MIDKLFHYTSFESVINIIKSCAFKTTNPENFNDPFECCPNIKKTYEYTKEDLEFLINKHIEAKTDLIEKGCQRWKESNSSEAFLDFAKRTIRPENINYQEVFGRHMRIISCSSKPNIIPMWAHYAANHTGVVIEFDLNAMPFSGLFEANALKEVIYSKDRVPYDHLKSELERHKHRAGGRVSDIFYKIANTKDKSWKIEQEIRAVLPLRVFNNEQIREHFFMKEGELFLKLQPGSIKTIYCGMRMSDKNWAIIESLAKSYFTNHLIQVIKINPSDGRYDFHPFCRDLKK